MDYNKEQMVFKRLTRWVCFNDPAWDSSGLVGGVGRVVGNKLTTYIQLTVA